MSWGVLGGKEGGKVCCEGGKVCSEECKGSRLGKVWETAAKEHS